MGHHELEGDVPYAGLAIKPERFGNLFRAPPLAILFLGDRLAGQLDRKTTGE